MTTQVLFVSLGAVKFLGELLGFRLAPHDHSWNVLMQKERKYLLSRQTAAESNDFKVKAYFFVPALLFFYLIKEIVKKKKKSGLSVTIFEVEAINPKLLGSRGLINRPGWRMALSTA